VNTFAIGNLLPATNKETALELVRSGQKSHMVKELVAALEKLLGKAISPEIKNTGDAS
jgi:hypothetical protein